MKKCQKNPGFTLIELIVALGVFSVVVTTAVGSVLTLINNNQKLQAEQNIMSQLSFALDTMAREIRSGYNYYCFQANVNSGSPDNIFSNDVDPDLVLVTDEATRDCNNGFNRPTQSESKVRQGISFFEGGNSLTGSDDRITYFHDQETGKIMRRLGGDPAQSILPSGIYVSQMEFFVTGSTDLSSSGTDVVQPTITIFIEASENGASTDKVYRLQTTLTQRILDL